MIIYTNDGIRFVSSKALAGGRIELPCGTINVMSLVRLLDSASQKLRDEQLDQAAANRLEQLIDRYIAALKNCLKSLKPPYDEQTLSAARKIVEASGYGDAELLATARGIAEGKPTETDVGKGIADWLKENWFIVVAVLALTTFLGMRRR